MNEIPWHSLIVNVYLNAEDINPQVLFEIYIIEIPDTRLRRQWIKYVFDSVGHVYSG